VRYRITFIDAARNVVVQEYDALDEADARRQATGRGARVLSAEPVSQIARFKKSRLNLTQFSNELIALLDAGLSLIEALDALTEKERDEAVRAVFDGIRRRLYEGVSFSVALAEYPTSFSALYVATVRASERSGVITESLKRYVTYQEQIDLLKKRLINASIYPAVLFVVGILVVVFLVGYVVPRFSGIYEDIGGDLPLASRLLMSWGKLLAAHGWTVFFAFIAFVVFGVRGILKPAFRAKIAALVSKIPTVGYQLEIYQLARLYRTTGMLLRGGIPVVTAFEMTRGLLSADSQPKLETATRAIREGQSMTEALSNYGLTTPVAERMLRVGEKSGNMGEMMERIAAFYDEEMSRWVDIATRLIEPAMMTVIGLVIGAVVVLMYFPIFELAGSIR
jgi:general secretion pathway protein F